MFLDKVLENNRKLVECAFDMHRAGMILPDTYILDLDTIEANARAMKKTADENDIHLYFMLKQIGRNPLIAKKLMEIGFDGAVAVDYKEALCMIENDIHISNVGHLVQIPDAALDQIISHSPDYVTVYSYDKILKINETAKKYDMVQKLLIRLSDDDSLLYAGQEGGFHTDELSELIDKVNKLDHVKIGGLTVFPALLYDEKEGKILPTANMNVMDRGRKIAEEKGLKDLNINLPSATCCNTIPLIKQLGGASGEPGHGLTGTTPLHKHSDQIEKVGYVYVSEISHCYNGLSYCYGGGHYRRGHMENVLVGKNIDNAKISKVLPLSDEVIDYHFTIKDEFDPGDTAVMCFRTQVFTTRSDVAVVKGIQEGKPELLGIYNSLGQKIERNELHR